MRLAMRMLSGEVLKMVSEEMLSVGIDIGTSTTQVIFSKLTMISGPLRHRSSSAS